MFTSLVLSLLPAGAQADLRSALAGLTADAAEEREAAQRWLAVNLRAEDFGAAAEAAKSGGLEARTRLARALGSDEQHFELAMLFHGDPESELSRVGEEAVAEMALRWFGDEELEPWRDKRVLAELAGHFPGSWSLRSQAAGADEVLDRLARLAPDVDTDRLRGARLEIAVDPALYADLAAPKSGTPPARDASVLREGAFESVLARTLADHRVSFEGFGFEGPHPWVRVAYGADLGKKGGVQRLLDACRDVQQYPDRPRGEGAARALGACGWPAPPQWLEKRWREHGDRNALAGVLLAASRGRVVPSLATAASVDALLGEVARARATSQEFDAFAQRVRLALRELPRYGADGADLAARVADSELGRASERESDAREFVLSILAGMRGAPRGVLDATRARLRAPLPNGDRTAARERMAILAFLAAVEPPERALGSIELSPAMLAEAAFGGVESRFASWFERVEARPAERWSRPESLTGLADGEAAFVVDLWIATDGGEAVAGALAAAWARPETVLGERLAERVRLGDAQRVRRALDAARESAGESGRARVDRLELLAGVATADARRALAERVLASQSVPVADWPLVGAVAGEDGGDALAEFVLAHAKRAVTVDRSSEAPWIDAFARAVRGLQSRGNDVLWTRMERELRSALRPLPKHPLRKLLDDGAWPARPGPRPASFEALEWEPRR